MDSDKSMGSLYQFATECKFDDFTALLSEMEETLPAEELGEAYLMRAQIKLFSSDETLAEDLDKAEMLGAALRFPCLGEQWRASSPNRFVAFSAAPHSLQRFVAGLPSAEQKLAHWYGGAGSGMVRQIHSEALYFLGDSVGALALAKVQYNNSVNSLFDSLQALYVMFRSYLVAGDAASASQSMLEMAALARSHPECLVSYEVIRAFATMTTGWGGDTPRFEDAENGQPLPVLDDRLDAIRQGISDFSPVERPFVNYAMHNYEGAYAMRQHYMDIFHALYWFEAEDHEQASDFFEKAYAVSTATGLVMPFAEYGKQLASLFEFIQASDNPCSGEWAARVMALAEQYEAGIEAYRE